MSESDIYFEQIDDNLWHARSRTHPDVGTIGWVRLRQVFEGGLAGNTRAARLWVSLDRSRSWFAAQVRSIDA
ncbi:hypothetical protein [Herbiconiux daphne]|uniref:Uncharacterized protein n=1 Tax=Herbiconiux daphne TaxID=2970914 RepID=A0ABT2H7K0_9MICO|nr:hypothetical protein [Herbiconiux daphne]MCS5735914.1 hypothetical protein [Herbiconiux daphne]